MQSSIRLHQKWVLPITILALLLPLAIIYFPILSYTKGVFAYPLDDAFIHMGIAKNLAQHQVWGISRFEFVSASSSILYPLILAAIYLITGPNILVPFLVNLAAAIVLLITIQRWLKQQSLSALGQLIILLAVIYFTPLPVIISVGMEHTLQILFVFLFVFYLSDWLSMHRQDRQYTKVAWSILLCGALVTGIRYEGMFLILIACGMLAYYRKWWFAVLLGIAAFIPILIFGLYSVSKGNFFLPNSVLLKSTSIPLTVEGISDFLTDGIFKKLYYGFRSNSSIAIERLMMILPLTYILFIQSLKQHFAHRCILICLMAASFLHLVFANTTWFYRYEAYMITPSIVIIGLLCEKYGAQVMAGIHRSSKWVIAFATLTLSTPLFMRSNEGLTSVYGAALNIYDQNYHMGRFLQKYYDSATVAINDLGCPSYYTDGKIVDLWGLGNIEIAKSKRYHYYQSPFLDSLINKEKVKLAVVYDRLYDQELLGKWKKVATWHINNVVVAGDPNLCFYAVDSTIAQDLQSKLRAFQSSLPPDIKVFYQDRYNTEKNSLAR